MLMPILDRLLSRILVESIKDEALGDLWEAHHRLIVEGKSAFVRSFITIWRSLLLVFASIQVSNEDKKKSKKDIHLSAHLLSLLPRVVASFGVSVACLVLVALWVLHPLWLEDVSCLLDLLQQFDLLILALIIVTCVTTVTSFDLVIGSRMFTCVVNATKEALEI